MERERGGVGKEAPLSTLLTELYRVRRCRWKECAIVQGLDIQHPFFFPLFQGTSSSQNTPTYFLIISSYLGPNLFTYIYSYVILDYDCISSQIDCVDFSQLDYHHTAGCRTPLAVTRPITAILHCSSLFLPHHQGVFTFHQGVGLTTAVFEVEVVISQRL